MFCDVNVLRAEQNIEESCQADVTDSCAGEMGVVSRAVWGGMAVWGLIINGSYYVYLTKCVLHLFVDVRIRFRSDRFLPNASLNISLKLIMLIKRLLSLHGLCLFTFNLEPVIAVGKR